MKAPEPARPSHTLASAEAAVSGDVVEIRPTEILRVCPECLVSNTSADKFCTACGTELPAAADTDLLPEPDVPLDRTAFMAPEREIDPPLNLSTEERSPAARRSERLLHGWHLAGRRARRDRRGRRAQTRCSVFNIPPRPSPTRPPANMEPRPASTSVRCRARQAKRSSAVASTPPEPISSSTSRTPPTEAPHRRVRAAGE
jgi:hypothetical protein